MEIVPEARRREITLSVIHCPESVDIASQAAIPVRVQVENRSPLTLTSTGAYPIHISYFWLRADGSREEGVRTRLNVPAGPGSTTEREVAVQRPREAGKFTLRVTLVQEEAFWFSEPPVAHFVDRSVEVRRELWWTTPGDAPLFGDNDLLNQRKFASKLSFNGGNRPLMLTIETVNTCNFDCIFCPYSSATRPKTVMPLELFELALDQYVAFGGGAVSMTPMVGDIFLDRFLPERFRLIRTRPAITEVSFTTNGSLLQTVADSDLAYIVSQMSRFHISIYGVDSEEHTMITRRALFNRVIDNVRRVVAIAGDTGKIHLGFRLLRERSQEFLAEWVERTFGRPLPFGWTTQYMNWIGGIETAKALPLDAQWTQVAGTREQCFLPLVACHIFSNGDVSFCPCDDYNGFADLHLGNIRDKPLAELYNSEKVRQLWKKLPPVCGRCTAYRPLTKIATYASAFDDPVTFHGG